MINALKCRDMTEYTHLTVFFNFRGFFFPQKKTVKINFHNFSLEKCSNFWAYKAPMTNNFFNTLHLAFLDYTPFCTLTTPPLNSFCQFGSFFCGLFFNQLFFNRFNGPTHTHNHYNSRFILTHSCQLYPPFDTIDINFIDNEALYRLSTLFTLPACVFFICDFPRI
jgi:hypothetical protein